MLEVHPTPAFDSPVPLATLPVASDKTARPSSLQREHGIDAPQCEQEARSQQDAEPVETSGFECENDEDQKEEG